MKITPLGTVSPYAKGNLNCPGFLIEYKDYNILLDAGNGICSNLLFPNCLNNLHVIISHLHKDHYGDLSSIMYASYVYKNLSLLSEKIDIYLPELTNEIVDIKETHSNFNLIDELSCLYLDDLKISFYNNQSHNILTYVIILENNVNKVVYTSDIGNTNLMELSQRVEKADILICESSFIQSHNIISNTHMHTKEAALLAKNANVQKLMLTHFWPEENKNNYLDEAIVVFENTIIAEENKPYTLTK